MTTYDGISSARPQGNGRILVFGINYEPELTGIALNTTWQTRALADRGWEVSVVTGIPHYPAWQPLRVSRKGPGPLPVSRRRHYVPREPSALRRGAYEASWLLSALPTVLPGRGRLDGVLAVVPALSGAALASVAAKRHGVPYGVIFQDVMGRAADMSGMVGAKGVAGPVSRTELALARRAAGVAIVAEGFRGYFLEGGVDPTRIHRIKNPARLGEIREDREKVRARMGWRRDEFVVVHSGSMGHKQGLTNVLAAALRAQDLGYSWLRFVLQGDGNQRRPLVLQAQRLGLANADFLPLADAAELPGILASADALLLCQRASVVNMSMPAKLGSYFLAGVPVVAAVTRGDETAQVVGQAGGVVVEPDAPERLLEAIVTLRDNPAEAAHLGAAGRSYAERHLSADAAIESVEHFVQSMITANGSRQ